VGAADRALAIAERLNLDLVVAEAFVNKGSALNILGRRREAIALQAAALDMAKASGDRNFEMRVRNNLASAISDDDPAGATRMLLEGAELARQIGDRGMYNWLAGTAAVGLFQEGRDWDSHAAVTQELLDTATLRADRIRLLILHGLHQAARGENLDGLRSEVTALVGDSTDPDDLFSLHMVTGNTALMAGDTETAYVNGLKASRLPTQNPEVALGLALTASIWSRNAERVRTTAAEVAEVPLTGAYGQAWRQHAAAAVAALEGRTAEALAGFREARAGMLALEQYFECSGWVLEAAILLPAEPEVRAWADDMRPLLEELRARPYLEKLDAALESAPVPVAGRSESRAETPTA
jgi:hypothetical protein